MSDLDGSESSSRGERATPLWVGAVVLVAAATGVLILSNDARLLRLGLVAALWAALIAAFAVAKLRGRITEDEDRAAELQQVYELELEREVAARREFELEAENEARRRVADEHHDEVQVLRKELDNLRQSLEKMLGGDVLFERVALRAESTRVRSLSDQNGAGGHGRTVVRSDESWGRDLPAGYRGQLDTGASGADTGSWPTSSPQSGSMASGPHPVHPASARHHPGPHDSGPQRQVRRPSAPQNAASHNAAPRNSAVRKQTPQKPAPHAPAPHAPPAPPAPAAPQNSGSQSSGPPNSWPSESTSGQWPTEDANTEMIARVTGEQPPEEHEPAPRSQPQQARGRAVPSKATPAKVGSARGSQAQPQPPESASKQQQPQPASNAPSRTGTDSASEPAAAEEPAIVPEESDSASKPSQSADSSQVDEGAHSEGTSVNELLAAYGNSGESRGHRRRRG